MLNTKEEERVKLRRRSKSVPGLLFGYIFLPLVFGLRRMMMIQSSMDHRERVGGGHLQQWVAVLHFAATVVNSAFSSLTLMSRAPKSVWRVTHL